MSPGGDADTAHLFLPGRGGVSLPLGDTRSCESSLSEPGTMHDAPPEPREPTRRRLPAAGSSGLPAPAPRPRSQESASPSPQREGRPWSGFRAWLHGQRAGKAETQASPERFAQADGDSNSGGGIRRADDDGGLGRAGGVQGQDGPPGRRGPQGEAHACICARVGVRCAQVRTTQNAPH